MIEYDDWAEKSYNDMIRSVILDSIEIDPESGCFEWTGSTNPHGYGLIRYKGNTKLAHRIAWIVEENKKPVGDRGHGDCICHHCDNPRCVNTDHLFIGSRADNMRDMYAKGRGRGGPNQPSLNKAYK